MRTIMETGFDIIYLISVITMGLYMIYKSERNSSTKLFGIMSVVLGLGDAFHLVPRILALNTENGFVIFMKQLNVGKAVTSITMTIFYIILYYICKRKYDLKDKKIDISIWVLAVIRIILTLMPQNGWLNEVQPLNWAIYRNIPFLIMGIIIMVLFYKSSKLNSNDSFKNMHWAIILSFGFYIPVVLFEHLNPAIGLLMIPKTLAYVWIVYMGLSDFLKAKKQVN